MIFEYNTLDKDPTKAIDAPLALDNMGVGVVYANADLSNLSEAGEKVIKEGAGVKED